MAMINDVTEQGHDEGEARLFHTLINQSNDSIYVIGSEDSSFLYVNSKAATSLGYTVDELLGKKVYEIATNVSSLAAWQKHVAMVYENKHLLFETEQKHKDGSLVPVEVNASFLFHNQKNYIVSICRDITERKKAENALIQEKNKLDAVMSALGDGLTMQDTSYKILYQNEVHKQNQGDHKGELCFNAYQGRDQICEGCLLEQCFKDGQVHRREASAETDAGTIYFEVSASPVLGGQGEITGGIETVRDITKRKEMEDKLRQAYKMEAIGTLAGGIAHDFNNILAAIIGYAEMAKDDTPEWGHAQNYIGHILNAGNRAKELVKQILTFSRKGQETKQEFQPSVIIKEGLKLVRASLPTTIEIQEEIDSNCGFILANPTNIHQVLVNLCANALHAMADEKGILTVHLRRLESGEHDAVLMPGASASALIELTVRDTGCGMDQKTLERIFEPYFTTKEIGKGTGMGLAVVHGIVQGCGGAVKVESELGKGSTFRVYFPAIEEETITVEEEPKELLPRGDERVLVVDDEESIAEMYKAVLEQQGYKVTAHHSSEKALEVFQNSVDGFDLIITDQTMPHLSGEELVKEILQLRSDVPIILCTGYSSRISEEEAKEIGVAKFLMKPVSRKDLTVSVREVLNEYKAQNP